MGAKGYFSPPPFSLFFLRVFFLSPVSAALKQRLREVAAQAPLFFPSSFPFSGLIFSPCPPKYPIASMGEDKFSFRFFSFFPVSFSLLPAMDDDVWPRDKASHALLPVPLPFPSLRGRRNSIEARFPPFFFFFPRSFPPFFPHAARKKKTEIMPDPLFPFPLLLPLSFFYTLREENSSPFPLLCFFPPSTDKRRDCWPFAPPPLFFPFSSYYRPDIIREEKARLVVSPFPLPSFSHHQGGVENGM